MLTAEVPDQCLVGTELAQRRPEDLLLAAVMVMQLRVEVLPGAIEVGYALRRPVRKVFQSALEAAQVAAHGRMDHGVQGVMLGHDTRLYDESGRDGHLNGR